MTISGKTQAFNPLLQTITVSLAKEYLTRKESHMGLALSHYPGVYFHGFKMFGLPLTHFFQD